ncbi:MAG TPA: cytochrome c biogenesis heme-transporting ATPase CcmA [Alphaproteobacteria bacterium]|jgi:heme exporter protein A
MTSADRLECRDLACLRGERLVFKGVSFALGAGEALRLTGPNGSGKSSLLRLLTGLGRPAAGMIAWSGASIFDDPDAHRRRLLFLGHQDAVKPWLTVRENLSFWAALHGAQPDRIAPALAHFALTAQAELPARFLSQGQRRRLALARFAAIPAALWLLDEPTTGLDDANVATLEALVAEHCAAGGLAVVSTHLALKLPGAAALALTGASGQQAA